MKKLKVYIAGPYTKGDIGLNVKNAMSIAEGCFKRGFVPFIPHLAHFQHIAYPRSYDHWLNYVMEWLKVCDFVLRIPGESAGADKEVELASQLKIPIVYSIEDLPTDTELPF